MQSDARSGESLTAMMVENLEFLRGSCIAYDAGQEAEAKRMAVTLRVLLHDTEQSHSLLGQLGMKDKLAFFDSTDDVNPDNLISTLGLVVLFSTNDRLSGPYFAPRDELPPPFLRRRSAFENWWTRPVAKEYTGPEWTRRAFVLELANREGGAHVDPKVSKKYRRLVQDNGLGMEFKNESGETVDADNNFVLASVRQIAHEVLKTASMPAYSYPRQLSTSADNGPLSS